MINLVNTKNFIPKSYRFDQNLVNMLNEASKLSLIKESEFVRQAIREKIQRQNIMENLDLKIDTSAVQKELQEIRSEHAKNITSLQYSQTNLEHALVSRLEDISLNLQDIWNYLIQKDKQKKADSISVNNNYEKRIIDVLQDQPTKQSKLVVSIGNVEATISALKKLEREGKIKKDYDIWELIN